MANSVKRVIDVASNEMGYLEKRSNANLDSKTANAGSGNFTKYWRDLAPGMQGNYWCNAFVNWCFVQAYGEKEAKNLLCTSGAWSYYTPTSSGYFKSKKQWYTSNPKVGDVIYFKNNTRICHIGIVYAVDSSRVYTIEGNTSGGSTVVANGGGVAKKSYLLNYSRIAGYGRPKYDVIKEGSLTPTNNGGGFNKSEKWKGKVTASSLNVRTGAGVSFKTCTFSPLNEGTVVSVCDSAKASNGDKWYYIKYNSKYGFVSAKYIIKKK